MSVNMGKIDRALRLVIAAVLVWLAFGSAVAAAGLLHWLALILAAVMVLTAVIGNCPLYSLIGLKTCKSC